MLTTGDTAPDIEEILALFHFRRRRRMIGADRCDVAQSLAELALFVIGSERRRAFRDGAEPFHIVLRQHEVMRTGFAGDIDPPPARVGDERDAPTATHMDDVQPAAGFRGDLDRATDRLELRRDWS